MAGACADTTVDVNVEMKKVNKRIKKVKLFCREKVNPLQVVSRLAFTSVEDRMLMNNDDIEKNEALKSFLGYDNPTTCQLNLNYLFTKSIVNLEKRIKIIEKKMDDLCPQVKDTTTVSGKKRKFQSKSGVSGGEVAGQNESEEVKVDDGTKTAEGEIGTDVIIHEN